MNTFDTNDRAGLRLTGFGGTGDSTRGAQGNIVEENIFLNNGAGMSGTGYGDVRLDDQFDGTISTNTFFNNSFGSTVAVFNNETSGEVVDFSGNWWAAYDDDAVVLKLDGAGALAVDFTSFLDDGTDQNMGLAGFQGDFSTLNVTALGSQTGPAGRIQEAIANVTAGGTVNILSGTYAGNVDATGTGINKNVRLAPGNSPGQVVINGDLILNSDDFLDIEINGQTAGSGYDQFIVNGDVVLNGAALNLTNTYTPVDGDKFTLIDNDAADGITGAFVGYPEGHVFTNFLGSGLNAYLTYVGGNGNDVVIHMVDSTPEITVPNNGTADQYTLSIVGGNFVLSETVSGTIISTFPVAAINGPLVINGEDGQDDTLTIDLDTIDHTTDIQIEFRGGAGGNDTLILERTGLVNTVEHVFASDSDGSILLDGETLATATITYTGLEPVIDNLDVNDRIFTFTGAGAEVITLSDDLNPSDDYSFIDSDFLGESVTFLNPNNSLTINTELSGGDGVDTVNIEGVDANFDANLTVNAGNDDTLTTTTVDIGAGIADLNAGIVNINNVFTTTGSVDVDAETTIVFTPAGVIDAGASNIDLTVNNGNIALGQVTTTGDVTLTATAGIPALGIISDINLAVNNITATNATLVSSGDVGFLDALEIAVTALEANAGGLLNVDNTGTLDIGFTGGINGVTVGAASTITSTGTLSVTEDITATGSGLIHVESSAGNVQMTSGTQIDGGSGDVEVVAANDVQLGLLTTSANVSVTATAGAITDNNAGSTNINAVNATLTAGTGAGVGDALETTITALEANTGAGLEVDDAGTLNIGFTGGIVGLTAGAPSRVTSSGTMTVTEGITASGGNLQLENTVDDFVLNASTTISNTGGFEIQVDSANDLTVNGTVQTAAGAITLRADNDLLLGSSSLVDTVVGTSTATVTLTADFDDNDSGVFSQDGGGTSLVNARDGVLNVTAEGNIEIADLRGATVQVNSEDGAILDNTSPGEAPLITATNAYLEAGTSVGTGDDINTAVTTLAGRSLNGQFRVSNTGALTIGTVGGFPAGVVATNGSVIISTVDNVGADDDLTINTGVTVQSTTASVELNVGDDFTLTAGGMIQAASTIAINVDPSAGDLDLAGSTVDLLGSVIASLTTITGGDDNDTFNILPSTTSPINIVGGDPTLPTSPGDTLNMDLTGLGTSTVLTLGAAGAGTFSFAPNPQQAVNYSSIENVITSNGAYHLVLDMVASGFETPGPADTPDTINVGLDDSGTNLLIAINSITPGDFFTGDDADILSFTVLGSDDSETLNINENNAGGGLPFFVGAAPGAPAIAGSNGSHLNASAQTFLDAEFAGASPFTVDDVTMHFDGGLGTDRVNVNFTTDHNSGYFADVNAGQQGSGNIFAATTAGADIDLGLSFVHLEGVGINGTTTGGGLRVDASSTPLTDRISISDVGANNDGFSLIDGNMQFTDLQFSGFNELQVFSGTGGELLDLIGLDTTTTLTDVELNADDVNGTDTGNDTIRVQSTPTGTVTNVTVRGGLGNDLIQIFDAGNTVDNIFAAIAVFGEDGTDTLTLDDSGDVTGDDTFEVTSTTIEGISSSPGTDVTFTDIDNLNVTGTAGNDTINVNLGAPLDLNNVEINGSGGDDTFNLQNSTPPGVDTRLNGDAGLDDFIFLASNVLTGVIDGGADVDTIDYSSYTPAVHVILNALGTTDGFRGTEATSILETLLATGFDNIDNLIGSAGVDTLQGPDLSNYWGITSTDEGFIIADRTNLNSGRPTVAGDAIASGAEERLDFTSFQNLIGGSQDDRFDLSDGAGLTGTLDGDSGNDSLDYRDFTTGVTVNLFAGTATNIGSLLAGAGGGDDDNSIENVFGGDGNDNITGDNDNNILGDGLGSDNLDGGGFGAGGGIGAGGSGNGGNDVFLLEPGNAGSADVITDIHGNDTVDFRFASAGITFDVDIINEAQTVFGTSTVTLQQIQPEQPDTNPSFMENVVGSQFNDYIYIDPLSQDGNYPIDGPPVLRSADGQGDTGGIGDFLDFDSKGQEVIDTGFSLTADGVGTVQYLNFENVTPFEDNPAFIIDNGDPGFTFTGDWPWFTLSNTYLTTGAGFEDDFYVTDAETPFSTGPAQAYWEFFGLTPGEYRVSVTWPFSENPSAAQFKATDAPFTVFDGTRDEIGSTAIDHGTFDLNQQLEPDDYSADGTTWEILDTFTINSRTLTVMLTNLADGYITADAIRIERVSAGPEIDLLDVTDALEPPAQIVDGNPDGIQFGPTELLTNVVRTFEITNSGSSDLTISNVLVPAGYETTLTDQVIGSGNTVSFTITMGSDTFGDRSGIFSFETDDVDESTFNILLDGQVSNVIIIDDGDADFSATPGFINFPTLENLGSNGYEGDVTGAVPNDPGYTPAPGLETATWTFSGLTNGNYRVSTTWSQYFNRVEDAPYSLNGGSIIEVDQSVAPSSFVEDGVAWFDLSTSFNVTTGELVVTLTNEASSWVRDNWDLANGVIADAVRIEYLPVPDIEITVDGSPVDDDTGVVDFGSTLPGIPVIKEFTITNLSTTDAVDVTGLIEFPPGFSILPTSPFGTDTATVPLAAGASITFSIQFDGGTNGTTFGKVSFTTGDADENPYNFTVRGEAGPATVGINDTNFSTSGTWQEVNPENIGDPLFLYANELYQPGTGANAATWSFDVEPGRYQVVAHWNVDPGVTMNGSGAASNAPYTISDGVSPVTVYVNQQTSSNDFLDDGILWEYIGDPFVVSDPSSTLTVQLTDDADGIVYADQIRIYRVVDPVVKVEVDGGTVEDSGTVNFDDTIVGASVVKTFTVTNYGERNMALSPTINFPAGFSLISGFGSTNLAPGASTTFTLQMDASSAGSFEGMVSFGVDSSDANPFNFTVTGSAANSMIIDNGDLGYTTSGNWIPQSSTTIYDYYEDDQDVLASDNLPSTDSATWDFTNLAAGTYSISSHWASHSNLSSNAQFLISGILGGDITVSLDQRYAADDFVDGSGVNWETLGTFQVAGGSDLTITLLDNGTPGKLAADAMRLEVLLPGSIAPEIEIEAGAVTLVDGVSSLDLGTAFYGESLFQTITITNTGTDTLNLSSISMTNSTVFGIPVSPDFIIYAGQSTTFTVEFNSTGTAGPETSLLTINSNDSDEGSFEIDLSATMTATLIIDDGDTGFSSTGDFFATSWLAYYQWDTHQLNTGDTGTATWEFSGLNPGDNFNVYATWSAHGSLATNAEYSINAGGPIVVNQRLAPNDLNSDGANWELLGTVNVTAGGLISVTLSDNAADGRIRADAIRIERTGPLMAAAGVSTSNAPAITQSDLDSVRDAALSYWKSTGLSETQISLLESVSFVLADLPDAMLGAATTTTILIDVNAAGYGWFVDDTPFDNSEFSLDASGELVAGTGSAAYGQMDLLTVMLHEMGHTLGYDHDDDGDSLMSDALDASERHLPGIDDFFSGVADGDNPLLD
ncbi:choice-of-anchor D domain-containing protein [Gimesia maris]|uniref:golvesin C-terminal-like domain-containing protein n=1 Tax=Gimesia maris TaxID=122 RepID=UPI003A912346